MFAAPQENLGIALVCHKYCICIASVMHWYRIGIESVSHQYHISMAFSPRRHCISIVSVWHRYHIVIASAYLGVLQTRNIRTMKNRTIALRVSSFSCLALASLAPRFFVALLRRRDGRFERLTVTSFAVRAVVVARCKAFATTALNGAERIPNNYLNTEYVALKQCISI